MDWFERLVGFRERTPDEVRECVSVRDGQLSSNANGQTFACGQLEIVALQDLRQRVAAVAKFAGHLQVSELVGDARALHIEPASAGALFQVASQFNLLEMVSPDVTPERGIGIYESDPTQGPACAIACGAGTIYRNYFVELDGQIGQTAGKQVDCLADVGEELGNTNDRLWKMRNGYALPSSAGLQEVDAELASMSEAELDVLRAKLKIGVQWDTQVTLGGCKHLVTQAYCSALPVAYSGLPLRQWDRFARVILEAAYEAMLAAAVLNAAKTGNKSVYLTLLGGGAFGNEQVWILDAVRRACLRFQGHALDVKIVSFRSSNSAVRKCVDEINNAIQSKTIDDEPATVKGSEHFCPGCGAAQKLFLRYPWYFCKACLKLAEDGNGRRLEFGNMSFAGGLYWKYADTAEIAEEECGDVVCLIHGRPVVVTEARFGGVVAQPLHSQSNFANSHKVVDLRSRSR